MKELFLSIKDIFTYWTKEILKNGLYFIIILLIGIIGVWLMFLGNGNPFGTP